MPSEKVLEQKKQIVASVAEKLEKAVSGVIVDYKGINVADDTQMRKQLREAGVDYFVIKNTLLSRAADQVGLDINSHLAGTTAIALHETDYVAAARILCKFAEDHDNFSVKCGFVDKEILDVAGVNQLATLPSREELVAKALCGLNAPISGFVNVLNANLTGLVRVLNAIAEKKEA